MVANDAGVDTVGDYMLALAKLCWEYGEEAIKRPFGNSGWQHEVYSSLARAGLIESTISYQDEDYIDYDYDYREGHELVLREFHKLLDPKERADHALDFTADHLAIMHPPLCDKSTCAVSEAANKTWIPEPNDFGRYPVWVDFESGELRYK